MEEHTESASEQHKEEHTEHQTEPAPGNSPEHQEGTDDISSKTIFVLVILTLAVSFIGAWVSVSSVSNLQLSVPEGTTIDSPDSGRVSFTIAERGAENTAGLVSFEITGPTG